MIGYCEFEVLFNETDNDDPILYDEDANEYITVMVQLTDADGSLVRWLRPSSESPEDHTTFCTASGDIFVVKMAYPLMKNEIEQAVGDTCLFWERRAMYFAS